MKRNSQGFRLNKNGKPITIEQGEIRLKENRGASYKMDGRYYFFVRESKGEYVYKP